MEHCGRAQNSVPTKREAHILMGCLGVWVAFHMLRDIPFMFTRRNNAGETQGWAQAGCK